MHFLKGKGGTNTQLRRRKNRIILLIVIVGSIFLCFQLFSFKVLNFTTSHSSKLAGNKHGIEQDEDESERKKIPDNQGVFQSKEDRLKLKSGNFLEDSDALRFERDKIKGDVDPKHADAGLKDDKFVRPRGTHVYQTELYRPTADGKFQCLTSKELVPYSAINDDYCDCEDSSDEPGTAACPQSVFHCTFQTPDSPPQSMPGSRVNDGVCDCCDGSDEWQGIVVFGGIHITGKTMSGSLKHAPCENLCEAVQAARDADEKIRAMGKRLKLSYLETGKQAGDNSLYGPGGVLFQLSLTCFDFEASEYKYTLCPFKSVTQQKFPAPAVSIGSSPTWKVKYGGVYVLKMDKGSAAGCPEGWGRKTVITFICGLSDKILQVAEDQRCSYMMKFSTPAAC